jgi:RNA polymerase sigma-54 factor
MALSQRLEFRQAQALVLTPQLMQAIKLLQLSSLDLAAYVNDELERNPLLERAGEGESASPADEAEASVAESDRDTGAAEWIGEELETSRASIEQNLGTELENVFPDENEQRTAQADTPAPTYAEWGEAISGGDSNLEAFISAEITLAAHLAEQMRLAISNPARRMIGQHLIDMVDEAGYISGDLNAVAEKLGASLSEIEIVLGILQTFDPLGICARNLAECLAIQLKERDRFDPAMQALVENLDLLAHRNLNALRRVCAVDDEDLAEMIAEIRKLNPKPGFAFGSTLLQPVVPDVFVRPAPNGAWQIELNSETLPKILLNQHYHAEIAKNARNENEKAYVADRLQSATWLMKALDQRAKTILKVSSEIVRQQEGFFAKGVEHLRPLNLKTVADAIGMHESTVSRVTANKFMATSRGIFELKYFFTSSIAAADGGEAHSAESVRHRIRQFIDDEKSNDILSDDTIVEMLRNKGIDIARRTVAKYREAMKIPSSVQRRREKQAISA